MSGEPAAGEGNSGPKRGGGGRRRATLTLLIFRYLGIVVSIIQGIVFIPIYLRFFSLSTYGAWLASGRMLGVLGHMDGGLSMVFGQRLGYTYGQQDEQRFSMLAGSGLIIFFTLCTVMAVIGVSLSPWVPGWVNADPDQHRALTLATAMSVVGACLNLARTNLFQISRAWQLTLFVGIIRFIGSLLAPTMILVGLFCGLEVVALGMAVLVAAVVTFAMAAAYTIRQWRRLGLPRPRVNWATTRELLLATGPMAISRTVGVAVVTAEPTFVSVLLDPRSAAVLSLTKRPYQVATGTINPLGTAIFSSLAHLHGESGQGRIRSVLREIFGYSMLLTACTVPLAFVLNQGFMKVWVGPEKFAGQMVNTALFLYTLALTRNALLRRVLPALGEINPTAWSGIAQIGIRVLLMLTLVTYLGIIGVPLSFLGGFLAISFWYLARVLNRAMGCNALQGLSVHTSGLLALATSLGINLILGWLLPLPKGWLQFFLQLALAGTLTAAGLLTVSAQARQAATKVLARLLRRHLK
jgi:O-antigen/teichoic acid export membrane protein